MRRLFRDDGKRASGTQAAMDDQALRQLSGIDYLPLGLTADQMAALEESFLEDQASRKPRFWGRRGR
ncbi:hypothetical protein FBZ89_105150 [Nitrospirillum amazonense]|uniref:Uncharacterized protein n=1 Tax=Nitrospirillum amazonense TaxID=28077 RepID=A0A560FI45_9PROT|nr:hypothetical protein [Nitrospirillum amazonense]TWB21279.1 hypothetical protein FBZ89_105150 [Nitrospirillum amazonense]